MSNIRLYAAYGLTLTMNRTGPALSNMQKARLKARQLSLTHPACEIRQLDQFGHERLLDTYVGGRSLVE